MIVIDPKQLSEAALNGIVEDFVSRSGRNHDQAEFSVNEMAEQVKNQIFNGELMIVYDEETSSAAIVKTDSL